ncbi:MAG: AraC family transcriptional regulator, partial [Clostridia bacterium]
MDTGSINNSNNYKCYVPILNVGADFAIFEVGYEKCESLHYWGPHKKFGYVFHYCISGKGILKIGDVTYNIKAGEVFYIAPDDQCFYQADEEDPWEYKWIYFGGMRAKSIISKTIFYDALRVAPCRNGVEFENIIDSIFTKEVTEINDICAMSGLYSFLGWLLKNFSNTAFVKTNKNSEGYWLQILNYIHINIYCNLSVAQISKAIGLERTYIYKLFKKNVGISTIDYIEHLRICMACDK